MHKKYVILSIILIFIISFYLLIQPYLFWLIAVKQKFTPGYTNKYYIYSVNTSIFKFQKEYTLDWIASDSLYVVKDYKTALKYILMYEKLGLEYQSMNTIRKFDVYMALKDYDNALKVALSSGKFRNLFEMKLYIATGDYEKAKLAYEKYWAEYTKNHPNYKNNPMKYFYLAQVEYSGKQYKKAYMAINDYFKNYENSTYIKAFELKADIEKELGLTKEYSQTSKRVKELKELSDKYINNELKRISY